MGKDFRMGARGIKMGRAAALPYQHCGRAALPRRPEKKFSGRAKVLLCRKIKAAQQRRPTVIGHPTRDRRTTRQIGK